LDEIRTAAEQIRAICDGNSEVEDRIQFINENIDVLMKMEKYFFHILKVVGEQSDPETVALISANTVMITVLTDDKHARDKEIASLRKENAELKAAAGNSDDIADLKAQLASKEEETGATKKKMQSDFDKAIAKAKTASDKKIESIKAECDAKVASIETVKNEEIKKLEAKKDKEIKKLEAKKDGEIKKLRENFEASLVKVLDVKMPKSETAKATTQKSAEETLKAAAKVLRHCDSISALKSLDRFFDEK
jgi:hypothetical protein